MNGSMRRRTQFLAIFALIAACHESPTSPGEPLPMRAVYSTNNSFLAAPRNEAITTPARWQQVWDEIHPGDLRGSEPMPVIDFSRETLLFAARGQQPDGCRGIQIAQVSKLSSMLEIAVRYLEPGAGCVCPASVISPVDVVAVAASQSPASFRPTTTTRNCN